MRPSRASLAATGKIAVLYLDQYQTPFNATLAFSLSNGASLTGVASYVVDDLSQTAARQVSISQTTTVITVTNDLGMGGSAPVGAGAMSGAPFGAPDGGTHGLSVGDLVQIVMDATLVGFYTVASVVSATSYTLTSPVSRSYTAASPAVITGRVFPVTGLTAATARTAVALNNPASAVVFSLSAYTSGVGTLAVQQGRQA